MCWEATRGSRLEEGVPTIEGEREMSYEETQSPPRGLVAEDWHCSNNTLLAGGDSKAACSNQGCELKQAREIRRVKAQSTRLEVFSSSFEAMCQGRQG